MKEPIRVHDDLEDKPKKKRSNKSRKEQQVFSDTTVQEKDVTFPTDTKLYKKIVERCRKIAKDSGLKVRQSY